MKNALDLSKRMDTLISERTKAHDAGLQVIEKVTGENRDFTPEERKAVGESQDKVAKINEDLKLLERQVQTSRLIETKPERKTETTEQESRAKPESAERKPGEETDEQRDYRKAFLRYVQVGEARLSDEERHSLQLGHKSIEQRDLSAVTGASGAYTIPQGFANQLEVAMKDYSGVLAAPVSKLNTDSGNDIPWPTVNDTSNVGELIAENTAAANVDPAFGQVIMKAYTYSSKSVLVPFQLLQDAAFNIEQLLFGQLFPERLGRILNTHMTTGTGTGQPQGVVAFAAAGNTAAGAAAITYDDVVELQHSVDPAYRNRPGAAFMFHDGILKVLRKLKDSQGRPIWEPIMSASLQNGVPGTLLGKPYFINQDMQATVATATKTMLFGDFGSYKIRSVTGGLVLRLQERYAEKGQVGFLVFIRRDARGVNAGTNPLKYMVQA